MMTVTIQSSLCMELVVLAIGVIVYHLGSLLEYKLGIEDTARVFPVHGLW